MLQISMRSPLLDAALLRARARARLPSVGQLRRRPPRQTTTSRASGSAKPSRATLGASAAISPQGGSQHGTSRSTARRAPMPRASSTPTSRAVGTRLRDGRRHSGMISLLPEVRQVPKTSRDLCSWLALTTLRASTPGSARAETRRLRRSPWATGPSRSTSAARRAARSVTSRRRAVLPPPSHRTGLRARQPGRETSLRFRRSTRGW
jgi:hypothetical protein